MGILNDIVSAVTDGIGALADAAQAFRSVTVGAISDAVAIGEQFLEFVATGDGMDEQAAEDLAELHEQISPADEAAGFLLDRFEESLLASIENEGQLTPDNVESPLDDLEGTAAAFGIGWASLVTLVEAIPAEDIDLGPSEIAQILSFAGVEDLVGREIAAELQEGVDPALKQKVHRERRSKQADFKDFSEANKRAKWVDEQISTRTGDIPDGVRDLYADADFGYLADPDTYGTIPDQTPLYEYVGLEHLEPEEIVEEAPQYGVMPSRAAMEQVLHTSGLPEDVKQVYLDLWGNIPKSQNPVQESLRLGDVLFQIDQKVLENVMTPKQAKEHVRSDIEKYIKVSDFDGDPIGDSRSEDDVADMIVKELEHRWELLYNLPNGAPDPSELQSWYEQGQITLEQFQGLWQTFGELGSFWAVYAKETIIDQGEDDIRKAHVLGRLTTQEAMFRLRQKGYTDEQASQILAGADPQTLVLQEAQQERTVADLPASALDGISESDQAVLSQVGLGTVGAIADATVEELVQTGVVGDETAQRVIGQAQRLLQQAE